MTRKRHGGARSPQLPIKVSMVSLGCPKNLVDSEVILGHLGEEGFVVTPDPRDAEVIIINTCGFIQSAKEESIEAILEMCALKRDSSRPKKVVVVGCLGQRYGEELARELPDVDAIIGVGEYGDIAGTIQELCSRTRNGHLLRISDPETACSAEVGRFRLTPSHYAYVKISEGCDNPCTFCAIPIFRGGFRSKPLPAIVEEVRELVASGAREILLISQDTTSYGVDLTGRFELPRLLEKVASVAGVEWIRLLYAYPSFLTDEMIDAIADIDKVVKYVDLPLQHISDTMLRRMGRRANELKTRRLLDRMRSRIPGLYLRTTFLVGFPGEDEGEFAKLRDFVREFGFERLGVFPFSEEEGTPAANFADQVPRKIRSRRAEEIMLVQQENAFRHNRSRKGDAIKVLVDGETENGTLQARSYGEAPEIDPSILILPRGGPAGERPVRISSVTSLRQADRRHSKVGDFVRVRITGSKGYDLLAEIDRA